MRGPTRATRNERPIRGRGYLRTSDVASAVGVHPNTVRLYEVWGFLPPIPRSPKGYRQFTDEHLDLMRLARTALHFPYPGGKDPVLGLVRRAVEGDLEGALDLAGRYLSQVRAERAHAEAAADLLEDWARGSMPRCADEPLPIGAAATLLGTTTDALRNWERNGLLRVPRDPANGYRLYGSTEINRLRVIRVLRSAGYGAMAILRMMHRLDRGELGELRRALDTPPEDEEDPVHCTDRWLTTLAAQERRAEDVISQLECMIRKRPR
ncbi:MAG: MerR family transcriptional regulator [Sphingomonadaceae bacterium]